MSRRLVLASASAARARTLRAAGIDVEVRVSDVDEQAFAAPEHADLVARLARAKAEAVAARLSAADTSAPDAPLVLGCDSMLSIGGALVGKPGDDAAARERWLVLRGRYGRLLTGHHLIDTAGPRAVARVGHTGVRFAEVTDAEIAAYTGSGEPAQVAGGFTIDGLGGWFIEAIDGDPHNVVGVSLPIVRELLAELGLAVTDLGYPAPRPSGTDAAGPAVS